MIRYIPLGIFALLVVLLYFGLSNDPRKIPSPLMGKPVPAFNLPQLYDPTKRIQPEDLHGQVWVLNVWASWCVSCRAEHAVLTQFIKDNQLAVLGLNYKDESPDAKAWLARHGDPYKVIAVDLDGRVGIDFGVYGVPESFIMDKKGIIRYKFTGPIDQKAVVEVLKPMVDQLRAEKG
jgi:cytochrome c biogenesis protein CcmG/thiol:disulfide interchange protein DsbE